MKPFVFENYSVARIQSEAAQLAETFSESGLLFFPGLLKQDSHFRDYVDDLHRAIDNLIDEAGVNVPDDATLDDKLTSLAAVAPSLGKFLADLGTQPAKLVSANLFKFRAEFVAIAKEILGKQSVLASPAAGDTLHLFPPSEKFFRYNLPIHQDYQYLMQSPAQLTFWCNLGAATNVGGCTFWAGSHKSGITKSYKNENGHFQIDPGSQDLAQFKQLDVVASEGDLVIAHSLTWHRSIENTSSNQSRICQIFRFSDLSDPTSRSYHWTSTTYHRPTVSFEDKHGELYEARRENASN